MPVSRVMWNIFRTDASGNQVVERKPLFLYSLRLDVVEEFYFFNLNEFMNYMRSVFNYYTIGRERALSGKFHLQCFVASFKNYDQSDRTRIRNYLKKYCQDVKQPVSFTNAKYPDKLYQYCIKDGDIETNMPDDLLEVIQNYCKSLREDRKKEMWREIRKIVDEYENLAEMTSRFAFMVRENRWSSMPRKKVVYDALLISGKITPAIYANYFYDRYTLENEI